MGVVNKVGMDHIGLLVHGLFNAAIPRRIIRSDHGESTFLFREIHA